MTASHRTSPDHELAGYPPGIKYIIGNEGAERFSFYGMKAILYVYLAMLLQESGLAKTAAEAGATSKAHIFIAGVYAFPVLGAILADKLLGKYQTILSLSLVYCVGHALMAIFDGHLGGTYAGLACIAVGAGGIKPCVSAHVGDQFGKKNWHLLSRVFQYFYFIINFGSFFSTLLVPILNHRFGPSVAFGVPGILMFLATVLFWLGRHDFVHVPAQPGGKLGFLDAVVGFFLFTPLFMLLFAKETGITGVGARLAWSAVGIGAGLVVFNFRQRIKEDDGFLAVLIYSLKAPFLKKHHELGEMSHKDGESPIYRHWFFGAAAKKFGGDAAEGPLAVFRIVSVFFLVSVFWMLFDQHSTTWVEQAKQMDRVVGSWTLLPSQIAALNPVMVMALIPILLWCFSALQKAGVRVSPLRKMSVGMLTAGTAFVAVALIQARIESVGLGKVHVAWQLIPYILITFSEVLVSITGLEFAYTQAPRRMKSIVMSFWLLCTAFGNWYVSLLAHAWEGWPLSKAFWSFAGLMFLAGILFTIRAMFYTYREYRQ